jgi:hypothetical protein
MKKLKNLTLVLFFSLIGFVIVTKNVFADIAPSFNDPKIKVYPEILPNNNPLPYQKPTALLDLIQPIHLAIGGVVILVVILSFFILSKIKNKK